MRPNLEANFLAEFANNVEYPGPRNPLASTAAVIIQGNEQGRVRGIGAAHSEPSQQGLLDIRRDCHRLALAATLAKHVKPLAHEVTMADIEAGNLAPPKPEPVGKPDDRRITRRLLRPLVVCRNGKQGLHASEARPFRVPVRLAFHALRFQAKLGYSVPP